MKIAVRYYTKSGNTKKLAEGVAEVAQVEAKDISNPLEEDVDILFLGCSPYAANLSKEVRKFIMSIDKKVGLVVSFSSSALLNSIHSQVNSATSKKGLKLADESFMCRGKFLHMHKGRPNEEDVENVKKFAKEVLEKYKI